MRAGRWCGRVGSETWPARWHLSQASSVLSGARGSGSGEVELFARAVGRGPWRLGRVAKLREDFAHDDGVGEVRRPWRCKWRALRRAGCSTSFGNVGIGERRGGLAARCEGAARRNIGAVEHERMEVEVEIDGAARMPFVTTPRRRHDSSRCDEPGLLAARRPRRPSARRARSHSNESSQVRRRRQRMRARRASPSRVRVKMPRTAAHSRGLEAGRKRKWNGSTHRLTGAWGSTWSTRCAAVSVFRFPQRAGQKPRSLHEKGSSSSRMQRGQWTRANPWASRPRP
jgi:hypothetical protein